MKVQRHTISSSSHLNGVFILHGAVEMVSKVLISFLLLRWVRLLWRRGRMRSSSRGGAPCNGLVPFDQEGDGGGGAGKQRYCLVMSGLCHVYTIDLERQPNTRGSERANMPRTYCAELMLCLMGSLITICSISFSWVFKERSSSGVSRVKYVPVQDWFGSHDRQRRVLSCIPRESDFHFTYIYLVLKTWVLSEKIMHQIKTLRHI